MTGLTWILNNMWQRTGSVFATSENEGFVVLAVCPLDKLVHCHCHKILTLLDNSGYTLLHLDLKPWGWEAEHLCTWVVPNLPYASGEANQGNGGVKITCREAGEWGGKRGKSAGCLCRLSTAQGEWLHEWCGSRPIESHKGIYRCGIGKESNIRPFVICGQTAVASWKENSQKEIWSV